MKSVQEEDIEFQEYGHEQLQNPFGHDKPWEEMHWADPAVHAWL